MKRYKFKIDEILLKKLQLPVRSKFDLIRILIECIKYMSVNIFLDYSKTVEQPFFVLYISKMSRLIVVLEYKIYSFRFPYTVIEDESKRTLTFNDRNTNTEINGLSTSIIMSFINSSNTESIDNYNVLFSDILEEVLCDFKQDLLEDKPIWCSILNELLMFESGYIRYDYDTQNENERIHPKCHIDVFYSNGNSCKIGLKQEIGVDWFIDFMDISTACKILN